MKGRLAVESSIAVTKRFTVYGRLEQVQKSSDDLGFTFRRLTSAPANVRDVATSMFDAGTVVIASTGSPSCANRS